MKKNVVLFTLTLLSLIAVRVVAQKAPTEPGDFQLSLLVSPGTWVIDSPAVEEITIHVSYLFSDVESVEIEVSDLDGNLIRTYYPIAMFADNRGELVIKFSPDMELYEAGTDYLITVRINNELYSIGEDVERFPVSVKQYPFGEEIVVLSGDKVRGDIAQGDANRVCNSLYEDCPYGSYDPFSSLLGKFLLF